MFRETRVWSSTWSHCVPAASWNTWAETDLLYVECYFQIQEKAQNLYPTPTAIPRQSVPPFMKGKGFWKRVRTPTEERRHVGVFKTI